MERINKETILRTAVLLFALFNEALASFHKNPLPFSNDEFYRGLSLGLTIFSALWAWWKNNSFSKNALKAYKVLKRLNAKEDVINEKGY